MGESLIPGKQKDKSHGAFPKSDFKSEIDKKVRFKSFIKWGKDKNPHFRSRGSLNLKSDVGSIAGPRKKRMRA